MVLTTIGRSDYAHTHAPYIGRLMLLHIVIWAKSTLVIGHCEGD